MKGLLNVLYRRILYKIPLKFLLILLALFGLLFASCNAGSFVYNTHVELGTINASSIFFPPIQVPFDGAMNGGNYSINCIISNFSGGNSPYFSYLEYRGVNYDYNGSTLSLGSSYCYGKSSNILSSGFSCSMSDYVIGLYTSTAIGRWANSSFDLSCTFVGDTIKNSVSCDPQYTSEECQIEYGLVESGALTNCQTDLNSCITNTSGFNDLLNNCSNNLNACNLSLSSCLQSNCPTTSGDISWSSLFINDIQHIGGPSIYIGIPEEIERDYSYVDDDMYITVDGYNVDYDKINGIIDTQNYKPTTEDFNYIISSVIPLFVPGLVIILFLYWIFKFIKKIF